MNNMPSGRLIAQTLLLQLLTRCYAEDICETCLLPNAELLQTLLQACEKQRKEVHMQVLRNQAQAALRNQAQAAASYEQAHKLAPASPSPAIPLPARLPAGYWAM